MLLMISQLIKKKRGGYIICIKNKIFLVRQGVYIRILSSIKIYNVVRMIGILWVFFLGS
jgi:hypothetical protein